MQISGQLLPAPEHQQQQGQPDSFREPHDHNGHQQHQEQGEKLSEQGERQQQQQQQQQERLSQQQGGVLQQQQQQNVAQQQLLLMREEEAIHCWLQQQALAAAAVDSSSSLAQLYQLGSGLGAAVAAGILQPFSAPAAAGFGLHSPAGSQPNTAAAGGGSGGGGGVVVAGTGSGGGGTSAPAALDAAGAGGTLLSLLVLLQGICASEVVTQSHQEQQQQQPCAHHPIQGQQGLHAFHLRGQQQQQQQPQTATGEEQQQRSEALTVAAGAGVICAGLVDGILTQLSAFQAAAAKPYNQQQQPQQQDLVRKSSTLMQQGVGPLLQVMLTSCEWCLGTTGSPPAPPTAAAALLAAGTAIQEQVIAVQSACRGALGWACAALTAKHTAVVVQQGTGALLPACLCIWSALTEQSLSLAGFYHAAIMGSRRSKDRQDGTGGVPGGVTTAAAAGEEGVQSVAGAAAATASLAAQGAAAAANQWLAGRQQQLLPQSSVLLVHALTSLIPQLDSPQQLLLAKAVADSAMDVAGAYGGYALAVSAEVVQGVDGRGVRQVLEQVFAAAVAVLQALWRKQQECHGQEQQWQQGLARATSPAEQIQTSQNAPPSVPGGGITGRNCEAAGAAAGGRKWLAPTVMDGVAAQALRALGCLQAFRARLPVYEQLLHELVQHLAASPAACMLFLQQASPCYQQLLQVPFAGVQSGTHAAPAASAGGAAAAEGGDDHSDKNIGSTRAAHERVSSGLQSEQRTRSSSTSPSSGGKGSNDQRDGLTWEVDLVLASRLAFLLPLLPVACQGLAPARATGNDRNWGVAEGSAGGHGSLGCLQGEQEAVLQQLMQEDVLPLVLLLLCHPVPEVSAAAHQAYAALLSGAADQGCLQLLEKTLPYAVSRSLEGFRKGGGKGIEGMQLVWRYLLQEAPVGSAVPLLCMQRLAEAALKQLQHEREESSWNGEGSKAADGHGGSAEGAEDPGTSRARSRGAGVGFAQEQVDQRLEKATLGMQLVDLVVWCLLAVDYQLLPAAAQVVEDMVGSCDSGMRVVLAMRLYAGGLKSEDYARKLHLVQWLPALTPQASLREDLVD